MQAAPIPRPSRPRLLPNVVEAAKRRYPSNNVHPVEQDGSQPGYDAKLFFWPDTEPEADVRAAVRLIRLCRPADKPCGFPNDLGCETQLYLGLAVRKAFPNWSTSKVAETCRVNAPDAHFFGQLLDLATKATWPKKSVLNAAINALRGQG